MSYKKGISILNRIPAILAAMIFVTLAGCDSDDDNNVGYIQLYNVSSNALALFLTVGQDDDDDYDEVIHSSVSYSQSSGYLEYETDTYDIDISWQDEDSLDDLEIVFEDQVRVYGDEIQFIVVAEEITAPNVLTFNIPVIDDDDELFNLRFLNMHTWSGGVDIYLSESDETFNEAVLVGQYGYAQMSDNQKFEQDDYIFYITSAGSTEILYQSDDISYPSTAQYIMVIRENRGSGLSPFVLDKVSASAGVVEYPDADAEGEFRIYNGVATHALLPTYQGIFDLHMNGIDASPEISAVALGEFSNSYITNFGDYSIALTLPGSNEAIVENHLLTLNVNSDKSVFFYLLEEDVDEDGDGDVDENGDGYVDEIEVSVNSLVVNNSQSTSIYDHQINVINLIDGFNLLEVYFVRSDETIDTANYSARAYYANSRSITLRNNTYNVYLIGKEDGSELILATFELILDENSSDLFLILEESSASPTGYSMVFKNQKG